MNKIKVAFFGSSNFSIPTLKMLLNDDNFEVKNIITMPPAEKNRGKKLSNNIVQDFALQNGFNESLIFTPKTLRNNNEIVDILKSQDLDFIIVVAYGKIITKDIIDIPKFNILNLHPSDLPKYRGAAPIERAIENGDKNIEICIMKVDTGLDTGDIVAKEKYILNFNSFASEIIPDISNKGALLMLKTIHNIIDKKAIFTKQIDEGIIYANKIDKSELFIDLNNKNLEALKVYNKIRAFNNNGCCYFILDNLRIKIIKAEFDKNINNNEKNYGFDKTNGDIVLKNGIIKPIILQKEGKKPINIKDFLNGLK